jgi:hypothetical protein
MACTCISGWLLHVAERLFKVQLQFDVILYGKWLHTWQQCHCVQAIFCRKISLFSHEVLILFYLVSRKSLFNGQVPQTSSLQMLFHLEAGHLCYFYYESTMARHHFSVAEELSNLTVALTGLSVFFKSLWSYVKSIRPKWQVTTEDWECMRAPAAAFMGTCSELKRTALSSVNSVCLHFIFPWNLSVVCGSSVYGAVKLH